MPNSTVHNRTVCVEWIWAVGDQDSENYITSTLVHPFFRVHKALDLIPRHPSFEVEPLYFIRRRQGFAICDQHA